MGWATCVLLSIEFTSGKYDQADNPAKAKAISTLQTASSITPECQSLFEAMVQRMLGLQQNIEAFEAQFQQHPQISQLIQKQSGLRVAATCTPFEAIAWAIAGQQISVSAALLRRKLIIATSIKHPCGWQSHPQGCLMLVATLSVDVLRQAGFSMSKAQTLLTLSHQVIAGELPLDDWLQAMPEGGTHDKARGKLQAIKGIGPWTVNYTLLRGYGWLGGSLHGDVAVRRALQVLLNRDEKISPNETQRWLAEFAPWQALVGAHLWSTLSAIAY